MDTAALFLACRKGDLSTVQMLVEERDIDLNIRDKWDSSPLYYACLCGHIELVQYLLDSGAKCQANTFDGERCVYGALNDEIRMLLKTYKAVTATTMRRDMYDEFLRRMYESVAYHDVVFVVHGRRFSAHRCVLAARCPYFSDLLATRWRDRSSIVLNNEKITEQAFDLVLRYLYTARMEVHVDAVQDVLVLARHCRLDALVDDLQDRNCKVQSFESSKPGVCVTVISLEPDLDATDLQTELGVLADQALPKELCCLTQVELPFPLSEVPSNPDVVFSVEDHHFRCHKVFFCGRSDYFKALLEDHFGENSTDKEVNLPLITLQEITTDLFIKVLYYIYTDSCEMSASTVQDLLYTADMLLLPGLKRQCAALMAYHLDPDNVVYMLRTARLFDLRRLEDQCAAYIASNLDKILDTPEFSRLVLEDAGSVKERQETDSIPVIDDVRFHITNYVQTFSDMYDADQHLGRIDRLLEELGLDG